MPRCTRTPNVSNPLPNRDDDVTALAEPRLDSLTGGRLVADRTHVRPTRPASAATLRESSIWGAYPRPFHLFGAPRCPPRQPTPGGSHSCTDFVNDGLRCSAVLCSSPS